MKSGFKTFVGISILLGLFLTNSFVATAGPTPALSILQGATNETTAQFSIVVPKGSDYEVVVDGHTPSWVELVEDPISEWAVLKFQFANLSLGRSYRLEVWDERGQLLDEREFQTLDTQKRYPKVALASCMVDWLHNAGIWDQMQQLGPDLVVFLGDTTYVDLGGPEDMIFRKSFDELNHWGRFASTRQTLDIYKWKKLVPIVAMMDDHDYGYDGADSSFPLKERANYVFDTFFAQRGDHTIFDMGPGQSFKMDLYGMSFLFLDGRNFRTEDRILGDVQLEWMKSLNYKPRTWMLSGSQFFGAYLHKDSFEGVFAEQFKTFMEFLKGFQTQFVFVSGDIHFSELMKIEREMLGYPTYELTSSSVHSFTIAGGHVFRPANPRRIPDMVTSTHNFLTVDLDSSHPDEWTVRAHGWRGQNLFETQFRFDPFTPSCSGYLQPQQSLGNVPRL